MISPLLADTLVLVGLVGFYGGLARELGPTTEFLDRRLSLGLSLGVYVAAGVATLLSLTTIAVELWRGGDIGLLATSLSALGFGLLFAVAFGLFFRFGIAVYAILLRVGLTLPRN
jgi:hypothetical protein